MRKVVFLSVYFLMTSLLFSCNSFLENEEASEKVEYVNLTVASNTVLVAPMSNCECNPTDHLSVFENGRNYLLPLKWIEGFDYEKGYEYKIKVKRVTPVHAIQDAPQSFYYLVETISKRKIE